jgi:hypothetical protein
MVAQGLTHKQIAELVSRETGYPIQRSTVSAALHRAGASHPAKKYPEEIPWTVREEHQTHYAARMLRMLGRRRRGISNSEEANQRLDSWLRNLEEQGVVVTYVPDTEDGFFYVEGKPDENGIPILTHMLI